MLEGLSLLHSVMEGLLRRSWDTVIPCEAAIEAHVSPCLGVTSLVQAQTAARLASDWVMAPTTCTPAKKHTMRVGGKSILGDREALCQSISHPKTGSPCNLLLLNLPTVLTYITRQSQ